MPITDRLEVTSQLAPFAHVIDVTSSTFTISRRMSWMIAVETQAVWAFKRTMTSSTTKYTNWCFLKDLNRLKDSSTF